MHQLSALNQEVVLSTQAFFSLGSVVGRTVSAVCVLLHDVSSTLRETHVYKQFVNAVEQSRIYIHLESLW